MDISQVFEATTYASPAPNGLYIASLTPQHLYIQYASSLEAVSIFPLPASGSDATRTTTTEPPPPSIQWSPSSSLVLLTTSQNIHVLSVNDPEWKIKISNGSGGLGRVVSVDVVGDDEHVLVVWEFGRVGLWDLQNGRLNEIGEVKMTGSSRSSLWGMRRTAEKADVLALICRSNAQDFLSLYLPTATSPFKSLILPTTDAQSLAWSPCGNWLAILDSPLTNPTIHIYTPDGFLFRSCSTSADSDSGSDMLALGPKSLHWTPNSTHLLLAASDSANITVLPSRTFSHVKTLNLDANLPEYSYQERISASGQRSFSLLAANAIPTLDTSKPALDMKSNATGTLLSVRHDGTEGVLIWDIASHVSSTEDVSVQPTLPILLLLHSPVRKMLWHPQTSRTSLILLVTEDGGVYVFDAAIDAPPLRIENPIVGAGVEARWIAPTPTSSPDTDVGGELKILITSRRKGWTVIFPEGRNTERYKADENTETRTRRAEESWTQGPRRTEMAVEEGDTSQDSLYDILSGRTPLPELKHVDATDDANVDDNTQGLDDTFREKNAGMESEFEY